ncbi:helix-turn-helix transcriptional regulator [Citrobacter sp. AN-PRR1]|uniref:helix-turn-helix domain-containing protein n=1 Tax=Citrobacter TaxID=544 RepID=UPI001B31F9C8|nr:helix-turn-helix transcriptional regulator [Citrobacter sp. AN-PRR1]MBP5853658.1 helix-turn-helix transcriptional regulator [Citrobacter sp. AN-PRR1]
MNDTTMHNRTFSKRLKEARLAKGLSQKHLGILAGIDEFVASPRINRYEKGVHQANIEIVQQLADVLELPLAYFYADDDDLASMIKNWHKADAWKRRDALKLLLSDSTE